MIDSKIYLDTAPFIYYLEQNKQYFEKIRFFFKNCYDQKTPLFTSAITKALDSIHLATAKTVNCNKFVTNDKQLKIMQEFPILTMDDL